MPCTSSPIYQLVSRLNRNKTAGKTAVSASISPQVNSRNTGAAQAFQSQETFTLHPPNDTACPKDQLSAYLPSLPSHRRTLLLLLLLRLQLLSTGYTGYTATFRFAIGLALRSYSCDSSSSFVDQCVRGTASPASQWKAVSMVAWSQ